MKPHLVSQLARSRLKKGFNANPSGDIQPRFGPDRGPDPLRQCASRRQAHIQPPRKESLQHLQVGR